MVEYHNWLIYGPILVCICLITLCMMYEKIYLCYLSSKHGEGVKKPIEEVPTLVVESTPDTLNHSRQQLTATALEQSTLLASRQPYNLHPTLVPIDGVESAGLGLPDPNKVTISRKLAEKIQESGGQYWINGDHVIRAQDHVIRADGIRLTDSDIYTQLQQLKSHSNTFTIGSQSGTLRLRTDSPGCQKSDFTRIDITERGMDLRGQSESDASRGEKRSEKGKPLSENSRSERSRESSKNTQEKVSKMRITPNLEFGDSLYHLLPSEDRYSG